MRSATRSLDAKDLRSGREQEESALKFLISARENLRTLLSTDPGTLASAARKYDRQQVQKLRRPPDDKNKELAQLEADLDDLAEREKAFSEEIEAKGGGGARLDPPPPSPVAGGDGEPAPMPPDSQQPPPPPEQQSQKPSEAQQPGSTPSKKATGGTKGKGAGKEAGKPQTDPVADQRKAADEAERLSRLAQKDEALTDAARQRLDAAAKMVQESSRAMEAGKKAEAAEKAREAARKLESIAREVGALKARELAEGLAKERDLAQALAAAERALAQKVDPGAQPTRPARTPIAPVQPRTPSVSVSWLTTPLRSRTCWRGCGRRRHSSIVSWPS